MKMILISRVLLAVGLSNPSQQQVAQQQAAVPDIAAVVRRIAATAELAAQEYRLGVNNGRIVLRAEVEEARLFLEEARRSAELLPQPVSATTAGELDALIQLVTRTGNPDSLGARAQRLSASLSQRFDVPLDQIPPYPPSLTRGKQVYEANCAGCHGSQGGGDGALAASFEPPPSDLTDRGALADLSPLDFYRRITIGVVGTAMPAFETRLPAADRWAAAIYATVLRLPPPSGVVPAELQSFSTTGHMTDAEVLAALGSSDTSSANLARLAAVRAFQTDTSVGSDAQVFARIRAQLESTYALARTGDRSAVASALDAYMTFEQVERSIRTADPSLAAELEAGFAALRASVTPGASAPELRAVERRLNADLETAQLTLAEAPSPASLFLQSLIILIREGLEAILIIGALTTFLVRMGARDRKRDVHTGVLAAVGASLVTALAVETIFHLSPASQEVLEGVTMLLATLVLFYVSYWLLSKMEAVKWNDFVKGKVHQALTSGSGLALASAAFLAVYREGFETVLFYKALFVSRGPNAGVMPILAGMAIGSLLMAAVYVGINRFGVRLPLRPFFAVTSAFLYYMAFVFAGKGVAELQAGGLLPLTPVQGMPRVPVLGIYPTVESLLAQGVLLALLILGLVWTFGVVPRRRPGPVSPEGMAAAPSQLGPRQG
jgi:high-affinity iron transporter